MDNYTIVSFVNVIINILLFLFIRRLSCRYVTDKIKYHDIIIFIAFTSINVYSWLYWSANEI